MTARQEPWGATHSAIIAGIISALAVYWLQQITTSISPSVGIIMTLAPALFYGLWIHYHGILCGSNEALGSEQREDYDALRQDLASGGTPAIVYARWLTWTLDRVDRFFGDPGRNDRSAFARLLGLETPGARWTAPAFDRCLLLALLYPVVTIVLAWIWSGHVGVAEKALGLRSGEDGYTGPWRGLAGLSLVFTFYAYQKFAQSDRWLSQIVWMAAAVAVAGAVAVAVAGGGAGAGAGAVAVGMFAEWSIKAGRQGLFLSIQGLFLSIYVLLMLICILCMPYFIAHFISWKYAGPLLLFFGLLTLINAPFDWFAIGLTRALLRRGLAPGGRGPYFYALIDVCVAIPVVVVLALVTVVAVQTFDDVAVLGAHSGKARILPLGPIFEGLEQRPGDPEFTWIWLMLFSTLIPSLINLGIGAAALLRGLPFATRWCLDHMPEGQPMHDRPRRKVAAVLAGQIAGGALIVGLLADLFIFYVVPLGLPLLGGFIRGFAEQVAAYNAPARLMIWLAGYR